MIHETDISKIIEKIINNIQIPSTVYRLQFNKDFTFRSAMEYISYFKELGIDAIYCSPYLKAKPGSLHGYNITDPSVINPELGSEDDFNAFCGMLEENGLSQIIDVVPNHMGIIGNGNPLWNDVLENGQASRFSDFFDIDWNPSKRELKNKVLIPILGDQFGQVLENSEIQLFFDDGEFFIKYWSHRLPLAPKTYPLILSLRIDDLSNLLGAEHENLIELMSIITSFNNLPDRLETDEKKIEERYRESSVVKKRLSNICGESEEIQKYIDECLVIYNGEKGVPESFDLIEDLLNKQAYRIASWRVAAEEINYRRFFDVNELAAIRVEDDKVFYFYHEKIMSLLRDKKAHGLRIDHPDGLYNPRHYFIKLQNYYLHTMVIKNIEDTGANLSDSDFKKIKRICEKEDYAAKLPLYLVIEKILERKEDLPSEWCVHGTVGYDFLNALNGLFIDRENDKKFDAIYKKITGFKMDFEDLLYQKKKNFAKFNMPAEINILAFKLNQISERNRNYRDFTLNNFVIAVREIIACFPVYRTYIAPDTKDVSERDEKYINIAVEKAKSLNRSMSALVFDFIREVLLLRIDSRIGIEEKNLYRDFVLRFQQITSPIMAKGMEDTAFYINNRFISLNEVGSDPVYFGYSRSEFHRQNLARSISWPSGFITTSTHDTKRSEDVRMRLNVLSELPDEWKTQVNRWMRINKKHRTMINEVLLPDRNTEYFIYQTLVGIWPDYTIKSEDYNDYVERIWEYLQKAAREAKLFTSWVDPDAVYEEAVKTFLERILNKKRSKYFLKIFLPFQKKIAGYGMYNDFSSLAVKTGSPGVLDIYQGIELWEYTLVDPDNRRPVDYDLRWHLLNRVKGVMDQDKNYESKLMELLEEKKDSRLKLYILWRGLHFRKKFKNIFIKSEYIPLEVEGEKQRHIVAFMRRHEGQYVLIIAGRFFYTLLNGFSDLPIGADVWKDTRIILPSDFQQGKTMDVYTGTEVTVKTGDGILYMELKDIFTHFSFAMLTNVNLG